MNYNQLTENERYQIYILKKAGYSQVNIALMLGRSTSTISRELRRNTGLKGYRPKQAQEKAVTRRVSAHKAVKLNPQVLDWVDRLLRQELSPQQVVDYLKRHKAVQLHHETVYRLIYADKIAGGDLYTYLRVASKAYRKRYGSNDRRGKIRNRIRIDDSPKVVDKRSRIGDWEGDTVIGKGQKGALLTMVERKSLYTVIAKLKGKNAAELAKAAVDNMAAFKARVKTITLDNGLEFAHHEKISAGLDTKIYFAHPYSSWERGTNENTNGLIRQYFPKKTDFTQVSDAEIEFVMKRLNNRPRQTRGGKSPNEIFMGQRLDLLAA